MDRQYTILRGQGNFLKNCLFHPIYAASTTLRLVVSYREACGEGLLNGVVWQEKGEWKHIPLDSEALTERRRRCESSVFERMCERPEEAGEVTGAYARTVV